MIRWLRSIYRLTKIIPRVSGVDWGKQDQAQLGTFLRTTGAGARLLHALRQGFLENCLIGSTKKTSDDALYSSGYSAGYAAALAVVDQLSGANGDDFDTSEEHVDDIL
jgi:hypothetical protein